MTDEAKRWLFILAGNVEVSHLYNNDGSMIGMRLETDLEVVDCFSPAEINAVMDRWINLTHFSGRMH